MKKRIIGLALVLCMVLSLALVGCGNDKKTEGTGFEYDLNKIEEVLNKYDYDLSEYITIGPYKNLEYTHSVLKVADGDTVTIDYTGKMDGKEFSGGSAKNANLEIGSGQFIEGFESGLIGKEVGDKVTLKLTFPDPYENNPDLAGKPVEFDVTVNKINQLTPKEQDQSAVWNAFIDGCKVIDYPELELNNMIKKQDEYYKSYADYYKVSFDEFLSKYMNLTKEEYDEQVKEYSKQMVTQDMALYALAREAGIEVSDKDYENAKKLLLEQGGFSDEAAFKEAYGMGMDDESVAASIEVTALLQKTLDFLFETAVVKE